MYIGTYYKNGILFMSVQIVFTPFVTRQRFAEMVGVTDDTLERWIRDGRVPCFKMGKRSLVDLRVWLNQSDKSPKSISPT
jgi:excisionase family DNA binding protein